MSVRITKSSSLQDSGLLPLAIVTEECLEEKFVVYANGDVEETWEFELDTYSLGVLAMAQKGLPRGGFELFLALVTPTIQVLAFYRIFSRLMSMHDAVAADEVCNSSVQVICFLLIALQVSNEGLEGFRKIVFSLRAFGGKFQDVKGTAFIGIALGFLQYSMAVCTVGLSMLVVSQQQTALDAFMNFVAVAFLTEVDNILVSARTVKNFVFSLDTKITVRHANAAGSEEARATAWPWGFLLCINFLALLMLLMVIHGLDILEHLKQSSSSANFDIFSQLWHIALCFFVLNVMVSIGNWCRGGIAFFMVFGMLCLAFVAIDMVFLYVRGFRLVPIAVSQVVYWWAILVPACEGAVMFNPFYFITCPYRSPSLVWLMLVYTVFCFQALRQFETE
eukprot:CAMPEP_0171061238 /NCGR_PEP_ID=MMETSP0766_2-20121228/4311_1 /TAXON_ID=439317 /ORGANISM="Gambierdiscus australes, Strain CAWD 149" /LENGTH=391 /DNA_ID=CAMNT_0011516895 /DNA_START=24 /DNA_END=1199 /DNA_ORIENTATION=-